tara:strand:+ start:472 stop:702 length:231 start_codon:yes stop_codon:yes gene_type:complete
MRLFLITLLAFFVSIIPLAVLFASIFFLADAINWIGFPVNLSYFLYGFILSYFRKDALKWYKNYWGSVWYYAGDRI